MSVRGKPSLISAGRFSLREMVNVTGAGSSVLTTSCKVGCELSTARVFFMNAVTKLDPLVLGPLESVKKYGKKC